MVALGAGASLAGLVTAFPQLIWLSERKPLVFGVAFAMLAFAGWMQWRARTLPARWIRAWPGLRAPASLELVAVVGGRSRRRWSASCSPSCFRP